MKDYESKARDVWQNSIKQQRESIDTIWLLTTSTLILAGAEIFSFFSSFNIKTVKSFQELEKGLVCPKN